MRPRRLALLAAIAALPACSNELPPRGQLVVHIDTDAPLPAAPDEPREDPAALFDRLRVEIFAPGAEAPCAGCARDFAVTGADFGALRVSLGIVTPPRTPGHRARVRLFRSGGTLSGEPRPGSTIEVVAALPATEEEGIVDATILLRTDDVARPAGNLQAPVPATRGAPEKSLVGTWPGAQFLPCKGAPADDEVCIPGGAYWMGDPRVDINDSGEYEGSNERLVVLSPFFLDAREVTVASFRASGLAIRLSPNGPSNNPYEAGGAIEPCMFTSKPGKNDERPVNCISWHLARQYCQSLGRDLPSEAQWERAAGALRSEPAVWGSDPPSCADAVFAQQLGDTCSSTFASPKIGGSGARDRLALGDRAVLDLMGNVSEWMVDQWNRDTEPCWGPGLFVDPVCDTESTETSPARSYRGGAFDSPPSLLRAAIRGRIAGETLAVAPEVGFRCARPDSP